MFQCLSRLNFSLLHLMMVFYYSILLMVKIIKRTKMEYEHFYIFSGIYLFMRNSVCPKGIDSHIYPSNAI